VRGIYVRATQKGYIRTTSVMYASELPVASCVHIHMRRAQQYFLTYYSFQEESQLS